MYFVISPTKEMKEEAHHRVCSVPVFIDKSKQLMKQLQTLSVHDIMQTMQVNEKIANINKKRYEHFKFDEKGQCAIDTYNGLQFKQLHRQDYDEEMLTYLNENVRILSGLYGVLKPYDSIYPYRLEMKYPPFSLYSFWQQEIIHYFKDVPIINVASDEYGRLLKGDVYHIQFKLRKEDKYVTQSTQVKMARGKFIDYVVKNKIQSLDQLQGFNEDGYVYQSQLSSENVLVFVKEG